MSRTASELTKDVSKLVMKRALNNLISLKVKLYIIGGLLIVLLLVVFIIGTYSIINSIIANNYNSTGESVIGYGNALVSEEVEQYRDDVAKELDKYSKGEYTDLLLALMMQESGGRGNDPLQASESKCGSIGCIKNPKESIAYGVKHFLNVLEDADNDIKLALQSYNFGKGFIDYVRDKGGAYTKELAISFSQLMYNRLKDKGIYRCHRPLAIELNACYGDIEYVDSVLRYLPSSMVQVLDTGLSSPLSRELVVTSPFGWRNITGVMEYHKGIDLRCTYTDSIHAVDNGTVVYAGRQGTYGNLVQIQHAGYITAYAHLSKINVRINEDVSKGKEIGMCGQTGRSYGTHLHFEVKKYMWSGQVDPAAYLGL
jgi:Lysozyme-like/Peptidase family M23